RAAVANLRHAYDVESVWPAGPHAARQVGVDAAGSYDVVVAMGGDGIVHHVVQGLTGTDTPVGIIPVGTANVLARQLGLPLRTSAAARLIGSEHDLAPQPALTVESLDEGRAFRRVATFSLGVGADAEVVAAAEAEP